jgi:hypothetical protein
MKASNIILISLILIGCIVFVARTEILQRTIEWQCSIDQPSRTCLARFRALGHLLSQQGKLEEARHWYQIGANHDDSRAMFHLAWVIEELAPQYLLKGVQAYATKNQFNAKNRRQLHTQILEERGQAVSWYTKSAEKGFAPSMNNLGFLYLHYPIDPEEKYQGPHAFRLFEDAAKAGNPVARLNLASGAITGNLAIYSNNEIEEWMEWTPPSTTLLDIQAPILERTRLGEDGPNEYIRWRIRSAAQNRETIQWKVSDLRNY